MQEEVDAFGRGEGVRAAWVEALSTEADGELASINADRPMPAASLVKMLIVEAALLEVGANRIDATAVETSSLPPTMYPSVLAAKAPGDQLSWREMCAFSLITSDNSTASYLLDEYLGLDAVNRFIETQGLTHTRVAASFTDENLGSAGRENLTTARDMAHLLRRYWQRRHEFPYNLLEHWLRNNLRNNRLPAMLPDDVVVAHKTGSLQGVVNDVGIFATKHPYIVVVLTDGQTDPSRASTEIAAFSEKIFMLMEGR